MSNGTVTATRAANPTEPVVSTLPLLSDVERDMLALVDALGACCAAHQQEGR